jgi:CCR4-NOT transcriptional complex subunit CAF120
MAGQTDWKQLWMAVRSGPNQEASGGPPQPGTPPGPPQHKRRISFFGRDHNQTQPPLTEPPLSKPKDRIHRKRPFLTVRDVTQAFAVYPERPELINMSTLMKIEGTMGMKRWQWPCASERVGFLSCLSSKPVSPRRTRQLDGLSVQWRPTLSQFLLIFGTTAIRDVFSLYGRPSAYSWYPRDEASMMYAYPVGPAGDVTHVSFHSPFSVLLSH